MRDRVATGRRGLRHQRGAAPPAADGRPYTRPRPKPRYGRSGWGGTAPPASAWPPCCPTRWTLTRHGALVGADVVRAQVLALSPASRDRRLGDGRRRREIKGRSGTKPGALRKHQIPIRPLAEWDDAEPAVLESDLAAHDGGVARGAYCSPWGGPTWPPGGRDGCGPQPGAEVGVGRVAADDGERPGSHRGPRVRQRARIHPARTWTRVPGRPPHVHAVPSLSPEGRTLCRGEEPAGRSPHGGLCAVRHARAALPAERWMPSPLSINYFPSLQTCRRMSAGARGTAALRPVATGPDADGRPGGLRTGPGIRAAPPRATLRAHTRCGASPRPSSNPPRGMQEALRGQGWRRRSCTHFSESARWPLAR